MNLVRSNLLLVDGKPVGHRLLARRLRRQGYEVTEVVGKEQALDWVLRQRVDLVLINVRMPGFNGLDLLRTIRGEFAVGRLPVIMLSGKREGEIAVQALKDGANDYVTKPIDFLVTLARIRNHLALKQAEEALRDSEERYALAAKGSIDGLWHWDLATGRIQYSNRWKSMLGFQETEITDAPEEWLGRVHPEDSALLRAEIEAHLAGRTSHVEYEYRMLDKDGNYRWMVAHGLAVRDASGRACRIAGSQTDITRAKVADGLTGLPNRVLFLDRLDRLMQKLRRNLTRGFGIVFLDLDRFKAVNDTLGHMAGDRFLIAMARRLEQCVRAGDTVARLGGDEFAVLLDEITDPADALNIAQRISLEVSKPVTIGDQEVVVTASLGISLNSVGSRKPEELLGEADTAMYRAKALGKNGIEIFNPSMCSAKLANW